MLINSMNINLPVPIEDNFSSKNLFIQNLNTCHEKENSISCNLKLYHY